MLSAADKAASERLEVEVTGLLEQVAPDGHAEHLAEVIVVQVALPIHREGCPTNDSRGSGRIVRLDQSLQVLVVLSDLHGLIQKTADGTRPGLDLL